MFWHHWRKRFQELMAQRAQRGRRQRSRQATFRPLLETLEKRQMLAVDLQFVNGPLSELIEVIPPAIVASIDVTSSTTVVFTLQNVGEAQFDAGSSSDYLFAGASTGTMTISIPPGSLSASASINAIDDSIWEGTLPEFVDISIASISGFTGATNGATASSFIIDDDVAPTVSLAFAATTVSESVGSAALVATLSGAASQDVTVQLDSPGSSATENDDYTLPAPFEITIPAGSLSASVSFGIVNDTTNESTETLIINLLSISPIEVEANSAASVSTLTITDDDVAPSLNVSFPTTSFNEEAGTASVVVTLSASLSTPLIVPLSFSGTGTFGIDYSATTTSVVFNVGETSATLVLTGLTDTRYEPGETAIVSIDSAPSGSQLGATTSGSLTINDNDSQPTVTMLAPAPGSVHESGSSTTLVFQLSNLSNEPVTIDLGTTGTATSGVDYSLSSTSLTIAAGQSTGSVTLTGLADAAPSFEGSETAIVTIDNVTNGTENGTQSQAVTIVDNETPPELTLALSANSMSEVSGAVTMSATITGATSTQDIVVPFTLGGTATSGSDYTTTPGFGSTASGTITILAGQTVGTVVLTSLDDLVDEGISESIAINVGTIPSSVTYTGSSTFAVAQVDNEAAPSVELSFHTSSITEDGGVIRLLAELSGPSSQDVVINLSLAGTATSSDYTLPSSITIPANSLSASIALTTLFDFVVEGNETVVVTIASINNGAAIEAIPQQVSASIVDLPVTLSRLGTGSLAESGAETIIASLGQTRAIDTTVSLTLTGTATSGSDYTINPTVIVIPANSLSASTAFTGVNDTADEADETAVITINVGSGATSSSQQVSLTLLDDDSTPTINLAVDNASINENGGVATVTATLSAPSSQTITASINLSGVASSSSDYTPSGALFTFAPGATVATLSLTATSDALVEPNESIVISLGNLSSGVSAGATTTVSSSIVDTVVPTVTLSRTGSGNLIEGASTSIIATLSQVASQNITVTLGVTGSATTTSDFTLTSTTITILAGSSTGSVTLSTIDDTRDEADLESVIIDIIGVAPGSAATENGTQSVTVQISDNDAAPLVTGFSISGTSLTESGQTASIVATIDAVSDLPVTINLAASGAATSGSDYVLSANSIVIPAGQTSGSITLTTSVDALTEPSETAIIDIASVTNGSENGTRSVQATISDVATPGVTLTRQGTGDLAENGTTTLVATLTQTSSQAITINLGATGTASSSSDYSLSANSIVIPAGSLSGTVTFTGRADSLDEPNETVTLSIASIVPVGSAASSGSGVVSFVLADDNPPPTISFSASAGSIAENGGTAIITATLAQPSGQDVTVNIALGGTASTSSDYSVSTTSFVIPQGQTAATFSVQALNDALNEANETIALTFTHPNATNPNSATLQVSITDDDPAPTVSLSASTTSISELGSGTVQFVATLSAAAGRAITVPLNLSGTAAAGGDYTPGVASITIPAGATSGSITLTAVNDSITEAGGETIIANLTAATNSEYQLSANSSSTVTILDNGNGVNVTVQFSTASQTVTESGGTRSIVVTLSQARGEATNVVLTQTGSATNLTDYSLSSTTISIPAGQTSASIAMTILTDNIVEDDETAVLTLTAPSGTLAGANTTQTVTVLGNIQQSGSTVTVVGTEGDDTFTTQFSSPDVFTVTLRGPGATGGSVSRTFTVGNVTLVNFDSAGGNDSSTIGGSSASESIVMSSSAMFYARTTAATTASSAITVNVTNSERNEYNGDSADVVQFNGTTGDDSFTGTPTSSEMTFAGSSNLNRVTNVKVVTADGQGGVDTVTFDDLGATTNESLVAGATTSQYFRTGVFSVGATNFEKVVGRSTGGTDDVQLTGSTGSETFYGLSTHSVMVRPNGGLTTIIGFDETTVLPGSGGEDLVVFVGSTGNDRFTGDFTDVTFSGTGFEYNVSGFDRYYAFGNGGSDTAELDDSSGNDTFYGIQSGIYVVGPTRATQTLFAGSFNNVKVTSSGGTDKAVFYDTSGADNFTGDSDSSLFVGNGFSFEALGFARVIVLMGSGNDQATLNDSSGNDVLTGSPENAVLTGTGYSIQVLDADGIAINGSAGGTDTASLTDTVSNDSIFALGSRFQLRSPRTLLRLFGFESITANSSLGGFDTRTVGGTDYALALTGNWLPF